MSRLLVDTSVLIDHLRGDERASRFLRDAVERGDELLASVLVRTEIRAGLRASEEADTKALLRLFRFVDVSQRVADVAGELARRYLRSHPGIDTVDYVIAATAIEQDAELRTMNVKHFPMFPRLKRAY